MNREPIDCIVRFHDARRLLELKRCVFSLVGQTYRPLNIILAVQRFTADEVEATRQALEPMLALPHAPTLTVVNWEETSPEDGHSALLNLGLKTATGRYVGFLDYDSVLYPEAYDLLVKRLQTTEAGIAFATVRVVEAQLHADFVEVKKVLPPPFSGESLRDLFKANFCPIHSYLIDRTRVPEEILQYDETLAYEEEYELLLRICAEVTSDFELIKTQIGDYYYMTDGSNTVPRPGRHIGEELAPHERLQATFEARRKFILVSPAVQAQLGLSLHRPHMSIRDAMAALGSAPQ